MVKLTAENSGATRMILEAEYNYPELVELLEETVRRQYDHLEKVELPMETVERQHDYLELLELPRKAAGRQHIHLMMVERALGEARETQLEHLFSYRIEINLMYKERVIMTLHYRPVPVRLV